MNRMKKPSSIRWFMFLGILAALLGSPLPAVAHHGWGGNETKLSEVTGAVTTGVSLAGPHATMKIKDADGHIWDVTMAPPPHYPAGRLEGKHHSVGRVRDGARPSRTRIRRPTRSRSRA